MAPIRVLVSATHFDHGNSGVGQYILNLTRALAERDEIKLYVAASESDFHFFPHVKFRRRELIPDSKVRGYAGYRWRQRQLPKLLRKRRIDVVHFPDYRAALSKAPIPQVVTVHDCGELLLPSKLSFARSFHARRIAPASARQADTVVAVTEAAAEEIKDVMKIPAERIRTIHNGVDHDRFRPHNDEATKRFIHERHHRNPFFFYFARTAHPSKNHINLIRAFESYKSRTSSSAQLILAGVDSHGAGSVHARRRSSPYREDIIRLGYVENRELPHYYRAALGLVFPSLVEGFGTPVLDAQACGGVVACSDLATLTEVAGPAAFIFDPSNMAEIESAFNTLEGLSEEEREERAEEGKKWTSQFRWETAAEKYSEIYRKAVGKG